MLRRFVTQQELSLALEATRIFPYFLIQYHSTQNKLYNRFPEATYDILLHENPTGSKLWIVHRNNPYTVPCIILSCKPEDQFEKETLFKAFDELSKSFPEFFEKFSLFIGPELLTNLCRDWLEHAHPKYFVDLGFNPCFLYYMNEEQKQKLLELEIKLPDGYHFSNVDFDKDDVEIITKTWKHSSPGDIEFTRQEITPFKTVETDNTEVLTASDRSPYWTRWDYDGKPINYVFMVRRRSAKNH